MFSVVYFWEVVAIISMVITFALVISSFIKDEYKDKKKLFIHIFFFVLACSFPAKTHYVVYDVLYLHIVDILIFGIAGVILVLSNHFLKIGRLIEKLRPVWSFFFAIRRSVLSFLSGFSWFPSRLVPEVDQENVESSKLSTTTNNLKYANDHGPWNLAIGVLIVLIAVCLVPVCYSLYPGLQNAAIVQRYPFEQQSIDQFPDMDPISSASFHSNDRAATMMFPEGNTQKVANVADMHRSVDEQGPIIIAPYSGRNWVSKFRRSPGSVVVWDYESNKKNPHTVSKPIEIYSNGNWMRGLKFHHYKLRPFSKTLGLDNIWSEIDDTKPVLFGSGKTERVELVSARVSRDPIFHVGKVDYYEIIDGGRITYLSPKQIQKDPKFRGKPLYPNSIEKEIVRSQVADNGYLSQYNALRVDRPSIPESNLDNLQTFFIREKVGGNKAESSGSYLQAYDLYEANAESTNSVIYMYTFNGSTGKGIAYSLIYPDDYDSNSTIKFSSQEISEGDLKNNQLVSPWPENSDFYFVENFHTLKLNGQFYSFAGIYKRIESKQVDYSQIASLYKPVTEVGIVGKSRENLDSSTFSFQTINQFYDWLKSGNTPKLNLTNSDQKAVQLLEEAVKILKQNHKIS